MERSLGIVAENLSPNSTSVTKLCFFFSWTLISLSEKNDILPLAPCFCLYFLQQDFFLFVCL